MFKAGDLVICVNDSNQPYWYPYCLKKRHCYKVGEKDGEMANDHTPIYFETHTLGFRSFRFAIAGALAKAVFGASNDV